MFRSRDICVSKKREGEYGHRKSGYSNIIAGIEFNIDTWLRRPSSTVRLSFGTLLNCDALCINALLPHRQRRSLHRSAILETTNPTSCNTFVTCYFPRANVVDLPHGRTFSFFTSLQFQRFPSNVNRRRGDGTSPRLTSILPLSSS